MPDTRRALLLAACAWPWLARAQAFDLKALMQRLGQRRSGEARFTEERIVSGFDSPLRSSGTLSFAAPDRFVRQTLQPVQEVGRTAGPHAAAAPRRPHAADGPGRGARGGVAARRHARHAHRRPGAAAAALSPSSSAATTPSGCCC
jgi:hypothetical protein